MLRGPELSRFRKRLLAWFRASHRDLPWRRTKDPYRIWLSEIMLQQTRVTTVIPYYERFLKHFPDVCALADAPEEKVLRLWAGLGYYSRARNLQKAAREIVARHDSRFPNSRVDALELPGIGEYSVAAILSIAYGKKMAVLDGNVARVLARLRALEGDLRNAGRWRELQATADTLMAAQNPGDWNQAMMDLGATVCKPKSPQCLLCPVGEFCQARKRGLAETLPAKRERRANEGITLAALVLMDSAGKTLLLPPPKAAIPTHASDVAILLSRLWHFPTIRVQTDAQQEVRQFCRKFIGTRHVPGKFVPLRIVRHTVTYRHITVHPFLLEIRNLRRLPGTKSLALDELSWVPISNLTRKIARAATLNEMTKRTLPASTLGF